MQKNILEYLESTVKVCPDKLAFSTGKEGMTFGEIYAHSRAIGSFLADNGFYGEPIAIIMDKHPRTLTAFWGVNYAGCFYACIDEKMPEARMSAIIEKLSPRAVICDAKNKKTADALGVERVYLYDDICDYALNESALADIRARQSSTDAIYVAFTSGSTGTPKGVVAAHRSVIDYTETLCEALEFDSDTVFGNQTPLYFDAPLKEIMPTLKLGATTYFIPKMLFSFPVKLVEYLDEHKINTICWVVSALVQISSLGALENHTPKYLTKVAFGSELFPRKQYDLWRTALSEADFYNLYGPTEATGMSCYWKADRELSEDEPIPIGRPFDNTDIILIDEGKRAEQGEICIRGTCLTMGYYNDKDKTDAAFVQNPLNTAYPELIYKTGDIGRINERGELVFLCRKDSQIKHMGHRIELGEIESAALKCEGVRSACCVYDSEGKRIVLYAVGESTPEAIAAALREYLPRYMLPASIEKLDVLPFTANGKIDRKGLKERAEKALS
ncbi:MAG: amino acid adenylation domain-containing protein [Clostridia bacterium]|nr:amino acid adenylation domain-containing protein [Clostridia bacterium]